MAESGFIGGLRCAEALDLLEAKRLRDGGWPLEQKVWLEKMKRPAAPSGV